MPEYLLAHDLGTSGNKATLFTERGEMGASVLCEYPTSYPGRNMVEQNADDWWRAVCLSTRGLLEKSGISPGDIAGVSFSGQMMGCLPVDRAGTPLCPMIIWADMRADLEEKHIRDVLGAEAVYRITGHRPGASYTAAKYLWLKNQRPDVAENTYKILQAKDYILFRLTGRFVTDYSDASGTNLLDLNRREWSDDILRALDIPAGILPELCASTAVVGTVTADAARETGLPAGIPVIAGGGDGSCATVGAGVWREGRTYNVIGSSSWISCAARAPAFDPDMRIFNWVHLDPDYITPCGTMQAAGYSVRWLRDTLCDTERRASEKSGKSAYALIDETALTSPAGSNGLLYLPYLLGERSPRWNRDAKGSFVGLTVTTERADILRSVLEGVGYNLKVIMDIMEKSVSIGDVTVIGGGAKSAVWLQILSDIWQKPLSVPRYLEEATSLGAAVCAGIGTGMFSDFSVIDRLNPAERKIAPDCRKSEIYAKLFSAFNEAYEGLVPTFALLSSL